MKASRDIYHFEATFERMYTIPVPVRRRIERGKYWVEERLLENGNWQLCVGTSNGIWQCHEPRNYDTSQSDSYNLTFGRPLYRFSPSWMLAEYYTMNGTSPNSTFSALEDSPPITKEEIITLRQIMIDSKIGDPYGVEEHRPFSSAPVRSQPRRTYDPARPPPDSEGTYVPMYLAGLYFHNKIAWEDIKNQLEKFGHESGLFNEISVKPLGRNAEPFQIQVRKFSGKLKGLKRNLIDVGYGVSQALLMISEMLLREAPSMFLLQQPEIHLHPSAQEALGSFFCEIASPERQLIVETHSDHVLDRVRMDVRDGKAKLKPKDVSILFFEQNELDVDIHVLRLDEQGNVEGQPESYRRFFMEETRRSLGL